MLYNIIIVAGGTQSPSERYADYLANIQEYPGIFAEKEDSGTEPQYPHYAVSELVELAGAAKRAGWCDMVELYSSFARDYQTLKQT